MMKRVRWIALAGMAAVLTGIAQPGWAEGEPAMEPAITQGGLKDARSLIQNWPTSTKTGAQAMIEKYGEPDAVTDRMLVWQNKAPFDRIIVYRDAAKHDFPMRHEDFLEQTIRYRVPEGKLADLNRFSEALVVDRTRGTLSVHCDSEKGNLLALNLANEIVTGKRGVEDAKRFLKDTMRETMAGKSSPYTEKLQFKVESAGEPAKPIAPSPELP